MVLELLETVNGICSLILVWVFILVGLRIMFIYRKQKQRVYIFIGLTLICLGSPWYSSSTSFIISFLNKNEL